MRSLFTMAGLFFVSATWLVAQEAGRTGNSSNTGQTGQNAANSGINQTPITPGQNRGQNATGAGQAPGQDQIRNQKGQGQVQPQAQGNTTREGQAADHASTKHVDTFVITSLRGGNRNEIETAKLAAQRASHPEVKAFAQQMAKEHSEFLAKLDKVSQSGSGSGQPGASTSRESSKTRSSSGSGDQNRDNANRKDATPGATRNQDSPATTNRDNADASGQSQPAQAKAGQDQPARSQPGRSNSPVTTEVEKTDLIHAVAGLQPHSGDGAVGHLVKIEQELADRCLASAQKELNEKQGHEFDKCYMAMQVGEHIKMVDKMTVFSRHVSGELQQVLSEGISTAEQHLQHAKQLAKQVDQSANGTGVEPGRDGAAKENANRNSK